MALYYHLCSRHTFFTGFVKIENTNLITQEMEICSSEKKLSLDSQR